ncbi:hypothetical protein [Algoriphagus winogradskyi]|nr:hypothetical protein [Algoriphagus winogradskyi]
MESYPYQKDFQEYLKAIGAEIVTDEVILLPLDSCSLCVDQVLADLEYTKKVISVILSGNQVSNERLEKVKKLVKNENLKIHTDEGSKSKSYDLNAFSPILINTSKDNFSYVSISPQNSAAYLLE